MEFDPNNNVVKLCLKDMVLANSTYQENEGVP